MTLQRNNETGNTLHDYSYNYITNSNKLVNYDGSGEDFDYDASGNLQKDDNKGITGIIYNYQNLPEDISVGSSTIKFSYDDENNRVAKHGSSYYIRGVDGTVIAEYGPGNNHKLWRLADFGHKDDAGNSFYYLKDHLGNIRVTVDQADSIVTKDDYYPFGLQMSGMSYNNGNTNDHLKYSGKELDEDDLGNGNNLDWYYFGARYYDPAIARWMNVDPLANNYPSSSPYIYVANNPLKLIDPNGQWWIKSTQGYYTIDFDSALELALKGLICPIEDMIKRRERFRRGIVRDQNTRIEENLKSVIELVGGLGKGKIVKEIGIKSVEAAYKGYEVASSTSDFARLMKWTDDPLMQEAFVEAVKAQNKKKINRYLEPKWIYPETANAFMKNVVIPKYEAKVRNHSDKRIRGRTLRRMEKELDDQVLRSMTYDWSFINFLKNLKH